MHDEAVKHALGEATNDLSEESLQVLQAATGEQEQTIVTRRKVGAATAAQDSSDT